MANGSWIDVSCEIRLESLNYEYDLEVDLDVLSFLNDRRNIELHKKMSFEGNFGS